MFNVKTLLVASGFLTVSLALSFADPTCVTCEYELNDCDQVSVNECYDFCQQPRKTFDLPTCNGISGKQRVCEYFKNSCGVKYGGCYPAEGPIPFFAVPECPPQDESCRICIDNVNDCQNMYGGCYDFCAEQRKVFEIPECNGVSGKNTVCEYMKNECGKVFGGCYPEEGPIPLWATPACP